jgi:pantoate--beta-alanine ligase
MISVTEISAWQAIKKSLTGKTIGFVPTMGNLHQGHLTLCQQALAENDVVLVSIFVNPTQFNQSTDFDKYPRTLENDKALLESIGVDYLILPDAKAIYTDNYEIQITETAISTELEGEYRPGHFNGMLTVVMKLLNISQAARAYFGEKDFQQLLLVKKMVAALFLPIEIISVPTQRAEDDFALSSRNSRLTAQERELAIAFPRLLKSQQSAEEISAELTSLGFKVDYIADKWQRRLGAVWLGEVRLIDNVALAE